MILLLALALAAPIPEAWSLEGVPIAALEMQAAPGVARPDLDRLRSYVDLAPDRPLHARDVREAVELLHSTGEVEDVRVRARRSPTGLVLTLELVPAPRLGQVVVEGDGVVDAGDVMRLTRLRKGETVWPERLEAAGRDVALHLAALGWLEAQVRVERRWTPQDAQAVFTIAAGPRVYVRRVVVEPDLAGLAGEVEPDPGEPFRRAEAAEAAERMRRTLAARGHWQARVEPRESYDPGRAAMDLTFAVDPGPLTAVDPTGIPEPFLDEIVDGIRTGRLASDAIDEAAERIENALRRRGHRQPRVRPRVEDDGRGRRLVRFDVEPGPRSLVASVKVEGLPPDVDVALATSAGTVLEDATLDADAAALLAALESAGHARAHVEPLADDAGGLTEVVFRVRPGPRTLVGSFSVRQPDDAPGPLAPGELAPELILRVGGPFRLEALARDRLAVLGAWRNAGFPDVEVSPEVTFGDDGTRADVVLRVVPGQRVLVGRIVVSGLGRTEESVVRRELLLEEGDPLSFEKVVESQRRLGSLGILQRVTITELDPERPRERTLVVSVEEAPATTIAYGIGYAERDRLRASVEVSRRNLFGMDRSVSAFARVSFSGSRFLATFREPWLLGRRQDVYLSFFREEDDRPAFDFVRWGGVVQTARQLTREWSLIGRWSLQRTHTFNVEIACTEVDRQLCSSRVSGPSASIVRDSRNDPLDPRRGSFLGADVQLSHGVLGGDSFVKSYLQAATYEAATTRVLFAFSGRLGLARRLGGERDVQGQRLLPLPDRFFSGGDYGLRGFPVDGVDPTGGNAVVLAGAEMRVGLTSRFAAAVFAEAGNVYALVSSIRLPDLRETAGLGVRYRSALGPLRVDWAFKLDRRPGESASRLHVTVGHAF